MNPLGVWLPALIIAPGIALLASPSHAQPSRCADCHFAQVDVPAPDHLLDWDRSPHAQNDVGCEKCHGGNAAVFEKSLAHRGILNSASKKSPVHRANLPATCGTCHAGPFVAFQESSHYALLKTGNVNAPTCSTCHDAVAGLLLSPKSLESQCNQCHGPKEVAPRAERARNARAMFESLDVVQKEFKLASAIIKKVDDRQRRSDLLDEYAQAQEPLIRAMNASHTFVYDELERYLGIAQDRVDKLMSHVANRAEF